MFLIAAISILLAVAVFFHIIRADDPSDRNDGPGEVQAAVTAVATEKEIMLPENVFRDGKARHFTYRAPDGKKIRYFIVKSSDGVIRAAFDACDVCWEADKGYFQKDDFMVCRNCGRRFQTTKVNVITGGCNPAALTRSLKDGQVVIPLQAVLEGKRYFR
jgi:uncharacterized membrane protein